MDTYSMKSIERSLYPADSTGFVLVYLRVSSKLTFALDCLELTNGVLDRLTLYSTDAECVDELCFSV